MMKIAISCHPSQGGSGVVASELAASLSRRGSQVHLVACNKPFRFSEDSGVRFHKVNVPDYPLFNYPPHDLSLANKLAGIVREYDLDIIHAHYAVPHAVTALLAKQIVQPHHVKVVTTLHGTDITLVGSHEDFYELIRYAILKSDALTAVSSWLSNESSEKFSLQDPARAIPNFVDIDRFHAGDRASYPKAGEEFLLVHGSNLRPVKRIAYTIRVFDRIQKELPARLLILGDGPEKGMGQELVSELGLSDKVIFNGYSTDMPSTLRKAHLSLLLSDYESFGLFALESMACGSPAAVTNAGGLPEVVTTGETGLLLAPGQPHSASKAIVELLSDRNRWEKTSATASAIARDRFSVESVVPLYEDLYRKIITAKEAL